MKNFIFTFLASCFLMGTLACGNEDTSSQTVDSSSSAPATTPPAPASTPAVAQQQPPYELADSSKIFTVDGIQIYIVEKGTGAVPKPGSTVVIDYHGYLLDGTVFDSSFDKDGPVNFGLGRLIQGWQIGLTQVPTGSKVKLIVPPELGYGDQGSGSIPPNSTLIFDIELFSSY